MQKKQSLDQPQMISQHAFGVCPEKIGEIAVLMERDRIEQYKGAFDKVLHELRGGVYYGITGLVNGREVSAIYSKGPSDIADCVAFLSMSETKCRTIFSTGSIGGLGHNVDMGDFVMADSAIGDDGYSQFLARQRGQTIDGFFDNVVYPNGNVLDLTENAVREVAQEYRVNSYRGRLFTTPGVSLENDEFLREIVRNGCIAIDMETAQFYAACQQYGFKSAAVHWVTDLPLTRNFFYRFHNPEQARRDFDKKHPIWLNMANIITAIMRGYINNQGAVAHEKAKH